METRSQESLAQPDVAADLKAAVSARRELDAEMEDHVLEAFLARIDQRIAARVDEQVAERIKGVRPASGSRGPRGGDAFVIPASLALAIPLTAVAGETGHTFGVIAALGAVFVIIATYLGTRDGK